MGLSQIGKSPILRRLGSALVRLGAVEVVEQHHHHHPGRPQRNGMEMPFGFRTKDVSPGGLRAMRQQAHKAWINHPLAKKGMRTKRAFVCQEGFRLEATCADEKKRALVQRYLDEHWAINWADGKVERRTESLGVYGDLAFWRAPENKRTGQYEIGALSRDDIDEVLPDCMNAERVGMLRMSQPLTLWEYGEKKTQDLFEVYRYDWLREEWKGEVLYLGVNRLDTMMRGISDFAPILDWLNVFDQLVYTESERIKMLRSLLFHLKMKGKDGQYPADDVLEAKRDFLAAHPPPPGTFYVSNESEEINMFAPEMSTAPTLEWVKFIFGLASGCIDLPEHYYYNSQTVNRATAKEMADPIYAGIRDRKREVAEFILLEHCIALQVASKVPTSLVAGFTADELAIEIRSRDPERDALDVIGQHLLTFGQALLLAQGEGWISKEQAGQQFRESAGAMGLGELEAPEYDSEALQAEARAKLEHRRPQLEETNVYPLAIEGKRDWALRSPAAAR